VAGMEALGGGLGEASDSDHNASPVPMVGG